MTKLLVSVKNVAEARLALGAAVDLIDLKDPENGALGALNPTLTAEILAEVDGRSTTSATVGEHHACIDDLLREIRWRAELGVDIVKIAAGEWMDDTGFAQPIAAIADTTKLVAVFFGDEPLNLSWLQSLADLRFYGVMLDTRSKHKALISHLSSEALKAFIFGSKSVGLVSGLAGSLGPQHVNEMATLVPDFIGMRGGLCMKGNRETSLVAEAIIQVTTMLLKHNKFAPKAQEISLLSLRA
jgi:(5-formylfuran-3-yl)methyl phosphate synthase